MQVVQKFVRGENCRGLVSALRPVSNQPMQIWGVCKTIVAFFQPGAACISLVITSEHKDSLCALSSLFCLSLLSVVDGNLLVHSADLFFWTKSTTASVGVSHCAYLAFLCEVLASEISEQLPTLPLGFFMSAGACSWATWQWRVAVVHVCVTGTCICCHNCHYSIFF